MSEDQFITIKEYALKNHCPECFSNSGLHLLFKQRFIDTKFYKSLWEVIHGGKPYTGTILNKKKDGQFYWCEQSITPMKNSEGKITNFVFLIKASQVRVPSPIPLSTRTTRRAKSRVSSSQWGLFCSKKIFLLIFLPKLAENREFCSL